MGTRRSSSKHRTAVSPTEYTHSLIDRFGPPGQPYGLHLIVLSRPPHRQAVEFQAVCPTCLLDQTGGGRWTLGHEPRRDMMRACERTQSFVNSLLRSLCLGWRWVYQLGYRILFRGGGCMTMPRWSPGEDDKHENGYRLNLLDGFGLFRGDQEVSLQIGCQRLIALLALVGVKSRGYVAGTLWPDVREAQASGSLRSMVWRVQRLAPNLIEAHGPVLIVDPKTRVDVASFIDDVHQLLARPAEVDLDHQLTQAMWNDLLPGWYDDWVLVERERLHQLQLHALETLALQLSAGGQHGHALDTALV